MKAILVIEVDDELVNKMYSCDFVVTDRYGSNTIYPTISFKPMPDKIEQGYPCEKYEEGYGDGWDKCIHELLEENNDEDDDLGCPCEYESDYACMNCPR